MNNNNGSKFTDGLLLGAIIGGSAIFLLGTEKGKKLLKVITQEGTDALSNFLEEIPTPETPKDKTVAPKPQPLVVVEEESFSFTKNKDSKESENEKVEKEEKVEKKEEVKKPTRRFFKKASK